MSFSHWARGVVFEKQAFDDAHRGVWHTQLKEVKQKRRNERKPHYYADKTWQDLTRPDKPRQAPTRPRERAPPQGQVLRWDEARVVAVLLLREPLEIAGANSVAMSALSGVVLRELAC